MRMKTINDHPLLIGNILARAAQREARRTWWRQLLGLDRPSQTHIARLGTKETVISPGR